MTVKEAESALAIAKMNAAYWAQQATLPTAIKAASANADYWRKRVLQQERDLEQARKSKS